MKLKRGLGAGVALALAALSASALAQEGMSGMSGMQGTGGMSGMSGMQGTGGMSGMSGMQGMSGMAAQTGDPAAYEAARKAAAESIKKAESVGGVWRDVDKFMKDADEAAKAGDYAKATSLVKKAKDQSELGYVQMTSQAKKELDFPDFIKPAVNRISHDVDVVEVMHNGKKVAVARTADKDKTMPAIFTKSGHKCPPFCVQPMVIAKGVETIGELDVLRYLQQMSKGDKSILVVDSRTPEWMATGTIPGSVNIPWNKISQEDTSKGLFESDEEAESVRHILQDEFGATPRGKRWNFGKAKTLVLFCNGAWCGQSPANIRTLLKMGYPPQKLKWYRGGMQDWHAMGLTTVTP